MGRVLGVVAALALAGCGGVQVRGVVRDEATGQPLPGAAVRVGSETTTSDLRGFYEVEVDPHRGRPQLVTAHKAGYWRCSLLAPFDPDARRVYRDVELRAREPQGD